MHITATLFLDPESEDKGKYYWLKMFLLVLLIVFPAETEIKPMQPVGLSILSLSPLKLQLNASLFHLNFINVIYFIR